MIRVMIVEDEPHAQRRLQRLIEQLDDSFFVAATAMDGEEAIKKLKNTSIDVIFTDIRMPIMDGTEMMAYVHSLDPEIMIVVVSGYQDFPYVTSALRAQAVDYLLKPLTESAVEPLLKKIKERYLVREHEIIQKKLSPYVNHTASRVQNKANDTVENLNIMLICAGSLPICESTDMCPGATFWSDVSLRECLIESDMGLLNNSWEFMGNTPSERIIITYSNLGDAQTIAQKLHRRILQRSNIPVNCVFNPQPISLEQVDKTIKRLRITLGNHCRIGESLLIFSEPGNGYTPRITNQLLQQAREARFKPERFGALFEEIKTEAYSQEDIYRLFSILLGEGKNDSIESYREVVQQRAALADSISSCLTLDELCDDLMVLFFNEATAGDDNNRVSKQIAEYLQEHFTDHITNQTLGTIFGYVPSYISILFRKEYDMSPSEYLTNIRIQYAKNLLINSSEILIRDVALRSGFKSQHHFSRTFKKHEGLWPTEYSTQRRDG